MSSGKAPITRVHQVVAPAQAQATDAVFPVFRAPFDGAVTAVTYAPAAVITGANTNTRALWLINKGLDGSDDTVVAELEFTAGVDASAFVATALTLSTTEGALDVTAGQLLALSSEAVGTGIADPGGLLVITYERA